MCNLLMKTNTLCAISYENSDQPVAVQSNYQIIELSH